MKFIVLGTIWADVTYEVEADTLDEAYEVAHNMLPLVYKDSFITVSNIEPSSEFNIIPRT